MNIIYMGTSDFAVAPLAKLAEKHHIVAVFTKPDSVKNRGNKLFPTPVKVLATERDFPVYTPKTLRSDEAAELIAGLNPDVIVVASYGMILPKSILSIPKFGCINIHASLLPKYRGASPVERAILAGDVEQGVSIMKMEEGLDTGDFCGQGKIDTHDKKACVVLDELSNLGADLVCEALDKLATNRITWTCQDENFATYAHKIEKGELNIYPESTAKFNFLKTLADSDSHPCKCIINGKYVRILESALYKVHNISASSVAFVDGRLLLGCVDGTLEIKTVKPDGKKEMDAKAYAAGIQGIKQNNVVWSGIDAC